MPNREVVITGMGVFSPIGIGPELFWTSLCEGRNGIQRYAPFDDSSLPLPFGGIVSDFDPKQYVRPRKSLKVMNRDIQLGFAAADMAYADSGLRENGLELDPERIGVLLGADMMPCDLDELIGTYRYCINDGHFDFDRWGAGFTAELFPLWMLKYLPNMPACHIGIAQDARGPNNTITMGEVSALSAIREGVSILQRSQADAVIAGGVSSRVHLALWSRHQVTGQSKRCDDPAKASRPFDAQRDGIVNSEGAATVVLETAARAEARGAKVVAKILGDAAAFEPHGKQQPLRGTAIGRAIDAALRDAGLQPSDIGFVVAHGASAVLGDRIEAQAIRDHLGDVPVTAPKGHFGHPGAAAGSLEMVLSVLAFQHELIPPTINYEQPDPQCPINVVHGQPMPLHRKTALILSHSIHGQAVAVIVGGNI